MGWGWPEDYLFEDAVQLVLTSTPRQPPWFFDSCWSDKIGLSLYLRESQQDIIELGE